MSCYRLHLVIALKNPMEIIFYDPLHLSFILASQNLYISFCPFKKNVGPSMELKWFFISFIEAG